MRLSGMGVLVAAALLALPAVCRSDTVNMADGSKIEGTVTGVTTGGVVFSAGGVARRLSLAEVNSVEFGVKQAGTIMAQAGRHVAVADDGSRLGMDNATIAEGRLKGRAAFGDVDIPLQAIGYILRPPSHEMPMDEEPLIAKLGLKPGDRDTLAVSAGGGQTVAVSGILLRMAGGQVVLDYDGTESPIPAGSVRLIHVAKAAGATNLPAPAATLVCSDGSTVSMESLTADGDGWKVRSPAMGLLRAARSGIAAIRFSGRQVAMLCEMTPVVRQTGFFDETFPWKKNRAVSGGPLKMNGRTYEQGIGVHARCALTYPLAGAYRTFVAVAGIDDSVRAGRAMLSIEVDGRQAFPPTLLESGKTPVDVRVDVKGADKMTILVDFAEGTFGSGARANLCDAVLAK